MNLAESMKHVLKSQTGVLFTAFWKDDVKLILSDVKTDFKKLKQNSADKFNHVRNQTVFETLTEVKNSAIDSVNIFKVVPQRIKEGFSIFAEDFLKEMEGLPDQKQKTIFSLKVLGALSSSTLSAFYGMRGTQVPIGGLKLRGAFAHYLVTELVFKISQVFMLRFMAEVEKGLTDEQDQKNLRYFRELLSDKKRLENPDLPQDIAPQPGDKALEIVENLREFILTGKKA